MSYFSNQASYFAPNSGTGHLISLRKVTKSFGVGEARLQVLRGVDLEIKTEEILLLIGPSGCGKTTLLSVVAGVLDSSEGEVEVFGQRVDRMSRSEKAKFRRAAIGFAFQQFNLDVTRVCGHPMEESTR